MTRYAVIDGASGIVALVENPTPPTFNPAKGNEAHPAPWRSLPAPVVTPPTYDAATQALVGPTYTVGATSVTESYTVRALTTQEINDAKDTQISGVDQVTIKVLFNHENRLRVLEAKAALTMPQFLAVLRTLV